MNPFQALYDIQNHGEPGAKLAALPDFPRLIDIEPVGLCNFKCLMCPTGTGVLGRPQGLMSWETWTRIARECGPRGTPLRLIGWGEPLLHPDIVRMIGDASRKGIATHINTNGSKLTDDLARDLIAAGLSSVKFSFQGVDRETYREMRQTDFFEALLGKVEMLWRLRGKGGRPFIAVSTSTTYETEEEALEFYERVFPICDQVSVGKTTFDYFDHSAVLQRRKAALDGVLSLSSVERRHPDPCPEVFDKLSIHWDGAARVCCNDFGGSTDLGNVNGTDIAAMWRHPQIEAYRERLARKEYSGPLCSVCYDYQGLTEGA